MKYQVGSTVGTKTYQVPSIYFAIYTNNSWSDLLWSPVIVKKTSNTLGSTNTRGQPTRRATTRVLPGAPRSAGDCFCRHRRSWDIFCAWRSPQAPRRQQRRGYSDRTSERFRDLVGARRVVCEAKRDEKLGLRRPCIFSRRRGWSTLC